MAELNVGTLEMTITADGSAAITEINRVGQAAGRMAGSAADEMRGAGDGIADAFDEAADAAEGAGQAGAEAGEKAADAAKKAGKSIKEVGEQLSRIGEKATKFVTLPIVAAFTASVRGASDLAETVSKTEVVFDRLSDRVMAWSETSVDAMGLAQGSALEFASTFGDMGKGMGLELGTATEMSMSLTQLAADLASFKNIRTDVAAQKLTAIYTGETEGLKSLGIVMSQANLQAYALSIGIDKQVSAMSQAELVALRYKYVMSATKDAQGDFARTSDSLANTTRKLTETIKQVGESFGSLLIPVITPVVEKLQEWIQRIAELDTHTKNIIISVAAVAAAIGPLLLIGGKLLTFLAALKAALTALSINPVMLILAAVAAATLAVVALSGVLDQVNSEAADTSGKFDKLKKAVEGGIDGEVDIDTTDLDKLEDIPTELHITAEGSKALQKAEEIVQQLRSGKYEGKIAIDGDPKRAEAVLQRVEEDIRKVREFVKIGGNPAEVKRTLGNIQQDIKDLEGVVVITDDPFERVRLMTRIGILKRELATLTANVTFNVPPEDEKALQKFRMELAGMKKSETFKGFGEFYYKDKDRKNLAEFNNAMIEAAGNVGNFQEAVDRMNEATDAQLQADIQQVVEQANEHVDAIVAAYKAGGMTREAAEAAIQAELDAKDAEITRLKEEAKAQKEMNALLADGTEKNDAGTVLDIKEQQWDQGLIEPLDTGMWASVLDAIDQAVDRTGMLTEGSVALAGAMQQVEDQNRRLTEATEQYNTAMAEADATEQTAIENYEKYGKKWETMAGALEAYRSGMEGYGEVAPGVKLTGSIGANISRGYEKMMEYWREQTGEEMPQDLRATMGEYLGYKYDPETDSATMDFENIKGPGSVDEALKYAESQQELYAGKLEEQQKKASEMRETARQEFSDTLAELQENNFSSEAAGSMISEIEETGVKVTEAQKNALTGVPEAIEEARAAVDEAIASNGEVDPAAAIANATEQSAQLVKDAAAGAVTEAAETAAEEAESQGKAAGESLVSSAADGITASVGEVTAAAQEIGSAIDQGVAAAIRAGTGEVVEAGRGMIRQTMGGMRWEAEIKSPSRKARNLIGKPLAQGVGVGFEQETPNVVRVVRRSTERLISGAAAVARRGSYTVPATAAPAAAGINYDAMGSAMERAMGRVRFGFNVGDRDLAQATREANAQQLAVQSRRVANRYGG